MEDITVKAELLLILESKDDWVNKMPSHAPKKERYKEEFLWVDANGCVFETGADFAAAERLATYPCRIYRKITVSVYEKILRAK